MQQHPINLVAWALVGAGLTGATAACVGLVWAFIPGHLALAQIDMTLHDTYYVVHSGRRFLWPMLLSLSLSVSIAIIGYTHTDRYYIRSSRQFVSEKQ
jgi:hypothetical protein